MKRGSDVLDAFHLPALPAPPTTTWSYGKGEGAFGIRIPRLTSALLRRQIDALLDSRDHHLAERPVGEIVQVIDGVAGRLLDPGDALRTAAEQALPEITGYSLPMIRTVLDRMAADWRTAPLRALLRSEFGDPRVLDGFRPRGRAAGMERAFGPRLATHIFSGNVPGVAVTSLIRSLLVKSATLGKTAVGEPLLPALFARGIAEADADLGSCLAVTYWAGGDEELEGAALEAADAAIVYGGAEAVTSVRSRTPPTARFLAYGPRISFGVVGREALSAGSAAASAAGAALDASTFDQQGCVSSHLFYAEEGGDTTPQEWARMLAAEMARVHQELPRGKLAPREASAIRQLRGEAEFAAASGSGMQLHASPEGTAWTVIYDPDGQFSASCLNRVIRVKPVADLEEVPGLVHGVAALLQSVGVAASTERTLWLAERLGRLGASRVVPLGSMAWPPPHWHHDGHPPLRELVRWCDVEV